MGGGVGKSYRYSFRAGGRGDADINAVPVLQADLALETAKISGIVCGVSC